MAFSIVPCAGDIRRLNGGCQALGILAVVVLALGCRSEGQEVGALAADTVTTRSTLVSPPVLHARVVYNADDLAQPGAMIRIASYLVVGDRRGRQHTLHVIDVKSGDEVASYGEPGRLSPWTLVHDPSDSLAFWVFDISGDTFQRLSLGTGARRVPSIQPGEVITFSVKGGVPVSPIWVSQARVAVLGDYSSGRLHLFDRRGEFIDIIGATPPGPRDVPPTVRAHAYTGTVAQRPNSAWIAVATRHAGRIELFDIEHHNELHAQVPIAFAPHYAVGNRGGSPDLVLVSETRFGYVSITASYQYIFALFSGTSMGEAPGTAHLGREIHIFNWRGQFLGVAKLDQLCFSILVDPRTNTLYATTLGKPSIVAYSLRHEPMQKIRGTPTALRHEVPGRTPVP